MKLLRGLRAGTADSTSIATKKAEYFPRNAERMNTVFSVTGDLIPCTLSPGTLFRTGGIRLTAAACECYGLISRHLQRVASRLDAEQVSTQQNGIGVC